MFFVKAQGKKSLQICYDQLKDRITEGGFPALFITWSAVAQHFGEDERAAIVALLYGAIVDGDYTLEAVAEDFEADIVQPLKELCRGDDLHYGPLAWKVKNAELFFKGFMKKPPEKYWIARDELNRRFDVPQIVRSDMVAVQEKLIQNRRYEDAICGAFMGSAVGDSWGYGLCRDDGERCVSSMTQMLLFVANAVLYGQTRAATWGFDTPENDYIFHGLQDWAYLQSTQPAGSICWIHSMKALHEYRNPYIPTIDSLLRGRFGYFKKPVCVDNKSADVLSRVIPLVLLHKNINQEDNVKTVMVKAAEAAAITHGNKMAWLSAALFAHLLDRTIYIGRCTTGKTLNTFLKESKQLLFEIFGGSDHLDQFYRKIDEAVLLAASREADPINIEQRIGSGWNAEDALCIAIYAALRYPLSFTDAVAAATQHSGNTAATGFLTGALMGAKVGFAQLPSTRLGELEMHGLMKELVDDLVCENHLSRHSAYSNSVWHQKYITCRYDKYSG